MSEKIQLFWKWFAVNSERFKECYHKRQNEWLDEILVQLNNVRSGLAVEFDQEMNDVVMTVSADGDEENFEVVAALINLQPQLSGWKFIAFRQPLAREELANIRVTVNGLSLTIKELNFFPEIDKGELYINIYSDKLTVSNRKLLTYACFMLLDNILGEYACVKDVSGYEFHHSSEQEPPFELRSPLSELKVFLDGYHGRA